MKAVLILLGCLLSCSASANYALNGQCFASASDALDSFNSQYPRLTLSAATPPAAVWLSLTSSSITGQALTAVIHQDAADLPAVVLPLADCTAPTVAAFDVVQAMGMFGFFFSGVVLIFVFSHGGGVILQAIRRGGRSG